MAVLRGIMPWTILIVFFICALIFPVCWCGGNAICLRCPRSVLKCMGPRSRLALRVWICMLFACIWLGIQPPTQPATSDPEWVWQMPLYAAIPVVLIFEDSSVTISLCLVLVKLGLLSLGALYSLVQLSILWLARGSQTAQGAILCVFQPFFSVLCVVLQSVRPHWKRHVQVAHLLELLVTFESFTYGTVHSDDYLVYRYPVFATISYTIGIAFIYLVVLFVAPRWECVLCGGVCNVEDIGAVEEEGALDGAETEVDPVDDVEAGSVASHDPSVDSDDRSASPGGNFINLGKMVPVLKVSTEKKHPFRWTEPTTKNKRPSPSKEEWSVTPPKRQAPRPVVRREPPKPVRFERNDRPKSATPRVPPARQRAHDPRRVSSTQRERRR